MLIKFLGITFLSIVPPLFIFIYLRESKKEKPEYHTKLLAGFLLVGAALIFYQRLTELSNPYLGTIKMASETALSYEQEIKSIKERVENQSATIDLIAKKSLDVANLYNSVLEKAQSANVKIEGFQSFLEKSQEEITLSINSVNDTLLKYKQALKEIEQSQNFMSLVYRAEGYDYKAFVELQKISNERGNFSDEAKRTISNIRNKLEVDRANPLEWLPSEETEKYEYMGPFTNEEIYERIKIGINLIYPVNYIRQNERKIFMKKLVELARSERKDLLVLNRITYAVSKLSGQKFYPWNIEHLEKWWEIHQTDFNDWPYAEFDSAINFFAQANYLQGLESFKKVLDIDKDADKSRALAIGCAMETGNIDFAKSLFEGYKAKSTRWAKWADVKITIETEGVKRGTEMLADVSREYRTFPERAFIHSKAHIWRKIDWSLYDKLMKE